MSVELTLAKAALITLAGGGAGFVNAIVGSGTLISFPTLVGVGFERLAANMANNVGLVPGSMSAAYGYRRELVGQKYRLSRLIPASAFGALTGALALLLLPSSTFKKIVPFLVLTGVLLVLFQPMSQRILKERRAKAAESAVESLLPARTGNDSKVTPLLFFLVFLTGIYGGYFGAAQGVILMGVMGIAFDDDLQRINATKNVLAGVVNGVAATVFIIRGGFPYAAAGLIAVGSVIGAQLGSKVGRRIPPQVLRSIIVVVGTVVAFKLLLSN